MILYLKELIKSYIYQIVGSKMHRFHTPMEQVMKYLRYSRLLPAKGCTALEMFGMFGLWHTKDYVKVVEHIDFFEIDKNIIKYAKKSFRKENMDFYCADSIEYIKNTNKKYDLVIADQPDCLDLYEKETGIPTFLEYMFRVSKENSILVFNIRTKCLPKSKKIKEKIYAIATREIKEMKMAQQHSQGS